MDKGAVYLRESLFIFQKAIVGVANLSGKSILFAQQGIRSKGAIYRVGTNRGNIHLLLGHIFCDGFFVCGSQFSGRVVIISAEAQREFTVKIYKHIL